MTDTMMSNDGADLCVETFGDAADPVVLLIAGGAQSMVWWEEELCSRLAAGGRHVVRYDHRDTGHSTASPAGRPAYTSTDLATDPLRIMDHLRVERAHLVSLSMGGGTAQYLAVEHADPVASLVLVSSSPAGPGNPELPPMSPVLAATFFEPEPDHGPDWADRDAVLRHRVAVERPYAWRAGLRRAAGASPRRARGRPHHRHGRQPDQPFRARRGWSGRPGAINAPSLVLHGTTDPPFPHAHWEALAREIPGARPVPQPGIGHEIPPPPVRDIAVAEILDRTRDEQAWLSD